MITQNPEYLIAIVQYGSISKAAQALYISQPSLSQYLKRLENSLDTELFDRSVSPMRLTDAGEGYYRYLLQVQQLEQKMQEELADIRKELRGRLRLGIALWRGACLIPEVFPIFHRKYPGVEMDLTEGSYARLAIALENHEIDLMIANLMPEESVTEFEAEEIMNERILLAVPSDHPEVRKLLAESREPELTEVPSEILEKIPLVLTGEGQKLTNMVRSALARKSIEPKILLKTANLTTAINLTAQGMSCCFVPEEGTRVCTHPGKISYMSVSGMDLYWRLAFLSRKKDVPGIIRRHFIECTKEILTCRQI